MAEKEEKQHTWYVITGLLAGLLGWFMAAELFAVYQHNQAVNHYNKAIQQIAEIAPPPTKPAISLTDQVRQRQEEAARQRLEAKKLTPGEHCFDGQRYRRLENGWQGIPNRPC